MIGLGWLSDVLQLQHSDFRLDYKAFKVYERELFEQVPHFATKNITKQANGDLIKKIKNVNNDGGYR